VSSQFQPAAGGPQAPQAPEKPSVFPAWMPPSRIAVLVFVVIAVVVIAWELNARWAWEGSFKAVGDALDEGDRSGKGFFKKDIDKLLSGSPTRTPDGKDAEMFTWSGLLQSYRMRVQYDSSGSVIRVEQPGASGPAG